MGALPVIGFGVNFLGSYAFGGFASGLAGDGGAYPSSAASHLISDSALSSLDGNRGDVAQIKAALTQLRNALATARANADAVPGNTTLKAVTADITQYVDQPTYVTVNGKPVQNGTVTVAQGTKQIVVGYERVGRSSPDIGQALKVLLRATVNVGSSPDVASVGTFGSQIAALLKNADFKTAVSQPDKASLDSALSQIDGLLASAAGLSFTVGQRAAAAAQLDLGALLLGASSSAFTSSSSPTGTSDTTASGGSSTYQTTASSTSGTSSGSTVSTVA